ncbi:MAG: serine/threonine protein kinase [Acidobacteria bacterium]|nr:serine/threonine protein kinase [Acidobacteriota bacterium]
MSNTNDTQPYPPSPADAERWQRVKSLINAALELAGEDREKFLRQTCGDDRELRREVEKLLASYTSADSFLEEPAARVAELVDDKKTLMQTPVPSKISHGAFVAGTILASRYRIIGLLGKGGMGEVYKAEDIKLSQMVALKFLPDSMERDKEALARFHNEVKVARQVAHPNVCRVFDIGEVEGRHFLSMEFIDGDDLSSLLRRIDRFSYDRAIEISRQLCIGLAAIHHQGILHRDFKPANVIVDSHGKVRITDFGIAGLAEEIAKESVRAGTPAYMSPEQISGRDVSARSDIYALGLVLYEIFTGKPTFTGSSLPELLRKQQSESPTTPSVHVKGFDPLVEQIILQCLEKNPKDRPPSALHVAMALPGGNPLQVALEAGQTPSPEMVAAAPKKGALRPAVALACLLGGLAMLVFSMFAAMKVSPQNRIPFNKSAEVLSERANEIIAKLGYKDVPAERWYRFYSDYSYAESLRQEFVPEKWQKIETGQPLVYVFVERQSPKNFEIRMAGNGFWAFDPQTESGQRTIQLDTRGRLVEFSAVPPQVAERSEAKADFSTAFQAAELEPSKFKEVSPNWTPPSAFDERKAWEGMLPDHEEIPLRVEAASFQGKTVFFKLIYPWTTPNSVDTETYTTRDWVGLLAFVGIIIGIVIVAVFLAWKNVKSGSGDRKGAFKTALVVFVVTFLGWLFSMNHVPSFFPEFDRCSHALREALRMSAVTWILYLALEPIVRRNLPDLIVSWNRLLVGDWRDPLVGRDVLLGTLLGLGHSTLIYAGFYAERLFYGDFRLFFLPTALISLRSWMAGILSAAGISFGYGFMFICLLAVLFLLLRRRLFAGLVIFAVMVTIQILLFTQSWIFLPFTLVIATFLCWAIARLGLLTMVVAQIVFLWLEATLLTLNFAAWFASGMFLTLGLILLLLSYGFKISRANQPLFTPHLTLE